MVDAQGRNRVGLPTLVDRDDPGRCQGKRSRMRGSNIHNKGYQIYESGSAFGTLRTVAVEISIYYRG